MSNAITNACRPLQMPPVAKNVLMAIADRSKDDGTAWPSLPGLCEATCFGRSAVIAAVKWLESAGFVKVEKATGRNNRFTILVDVVTAAVASQPVRHAHRSATRTRSADTPVRLAHPTSTPGAPPPVHVADLPVHVAHPNHQEPPSSTTKEPSGGARKRAARNCPPSFAVTPVLREWAATKCPGVDVDRETEKFRDHTFGTPRTDWDGAWRNWMRKAADEPAWKREQRERMTQLAPGVAAKPRRQVHSFTDIDYREGISANGTIG